MGSQLLQLLLKASQDKRFVCEEADRTLNTMVQSLTPLPLLQKLRAYASHANPRVRAKAAVSVSACVSKMVNTKKNEVFSCLLSIPFFLKQNGGFLQISGA